MLAILIYICAVWMIGKGALMLYGKYVPVTARTAIEDENDKRAWCRENGIINIVWGVDFAFYATGTLLEVGKVLGLLWLIIAVAVGIVCCVAVFRAALRNWIPENTVLSHDLLEGCFLRAGFMGDVAFYDGEPSTFSAWWKRQHRWMRGDWQLLPFLLPHLRDAADSPHKTPLSLLSRAKMLDNLRRTLLAPAVFNLLLLMPYFGGGAYVWIGFVALWDGFLWDAGSLLCSFFTQGFRGRDAWGALRERATAAQRALLEFVTLPFAAVKNGDAMGRSLWRVLVSHRNMLEWQTAAETSKKAQQQGIVGTCRLLCARHARTHADARPPRVRTPSQGLRAWRTEYIPHPGRSCR